MVVVLTVLLGIVYPLVMTGLAQVLFPSQANGSLIRDSAGNVIGSALIGQNFTESGSTSTRARRRLAADGYDATSSGRLEPGSDQPEADRRRQGPRDRVPGGERSGRRRAGAGGCRHRLRQRARSRYQSGQCADPGQAGGQARGLSEDQVRSLVNENTEGRTLVRARRAAGQRAEAQPGARWSLSMRDASTAPDATAQRGRDAGPRSAPGWRGRAWPPSRLPGHRARRRQDLHRARGAASPQAARHRRRDRLPRDARTPEDRRARRGPGNRPPQEDPVQGRDGRRDGHRGGHRAPAGRRSGRRARAHQRAGLEAREALAGRRGPARRRASPSSARSTSSIWRAWPTSSRTSPVSTSTNASPTG